MQTHEEDPIFSAKYFISQMNTSLGVLELPTSISVGHLALTTELPPGRCLYLAVTIWRLGKVKWLLQGLTAGKRQEQDASLAPYVLPTSPSGNSRLPSRRGEYEWWGFGHLIGWYFHYYSDLLRLGTACVSDPDAFLGCVPHPAAVRRWAEGGSYS